MCIHVSHWDPVVLCARRREPTNSMASTGVVVPAFTGEHSLSYGGSDDCEPTATTIPAVNNSSPTTNGV